MPMESLQKIKELYEPISPRTRKTKYLTSHKDESLLTTTNGIGMIQSGQAELD